MRTLDWYLRTAQEQNGLPSGRALARELGVTHTAARAWTMGTAWPTDAHMVKLAQMCGVNPTVAVAELGRWKAEGTAAAPVWDNILRHLPQAAACLLIVFAVTVGDAKAKVIGTGAEQISVATAFSINYATNGDGRVDRVCSRRSPPLAFAPPSTKGPPPKATGPSRNLLVDFP